MGKRIVVHEEPRRNADSGGMAVDFGTYHHSTAEQSNEIRAWAEKEFTSTLLSLYPPRLALRILDAGCGLGFLSYVAAKCFPKARITGVDLFEHKSISGVSLEKAVKNMKALRTASRISLHRHDLTEPLNPRVKYDLTVSNLVFHNLGKRRFDAYENVFAALKPGGYFIIADLFPNAGEDMRFFRKHSTLVHESKSSGSGRWNPQVKVFRKTE